MTKMPANPVNTHFLPAAAVFETLIRTVFGLLSIPPFQTGNGAQKRRQPVEGHPEDSWPSWNLLRPTRAPAKSVVA